MEILFVMLSLPLFRSLFLFKEVLWNLPFVFRFCTKVIGKDFSLEYKEGMVIGEERCLTFLYLFVFISHTKKITDTKGSFGFRRFNGDNGIYCMKGR